MFNVFDGKKCVMEGIETFGDACDYVIWYLGRFGNHQLKDFLRVGYPYRYNREEKIVIYFEPKAQ